MPRRAVAAATAAAVRPMSSTTSRSACPAVRLTTSSTSGAAGPDSSPVSSRADCWVGQTTTVWPDLSGWEQSGMAAGLMKPRTATPTAIKVITSEVTSSTLRKLRTRSCSRSAALLAPRMLLTMVLRSPSMMTVRSLRHGRGLGRGGLGRRGGRR